MKVTIHTSIDIQLQINGENRDYAEKNAVGVALRSIARAIADESHHVGLDAEKIEIFSQLREEQQFDARLEKSRANRDKAIDALARAEIASLPKPARLEKKS